MLNGSETMEIAVIFSVSFIVFCLFLLAKRGLTKKAMELDELECSKTLFIMNNPILKPNVISLLRILGSIIWVFLAYYELWYWAIPLFVAVALTDALDGLIARRFNFVSETGKWLDPLADKATTLSCFCFFVWQGVLSSYIFVALLVLQTLSQLSRPLLVWLSKRTNTKFDTGAKTWGKVKATAEFLTISLILFAERADVISAGYVQPVLNGLFGVTVLLCAMSCYEKLAPPLFSIYAKHGVSGAFAKIF